MSREFVSQKWWAYCGRRRFASSMSVAPCSLPAVAGPVLARGAAMVAAEGAIHVAAVGKSRPSSDGAHGEVG